MWTDDSKHYFTEQLNNALMQSGIGHTIQYIQVNMLINQVNLTVEYSVVQGEEQ